MSDSPSRNTSAGGGPIIVKPREADPAGLKANKPAKRAASDEMTHHDMALAMGAGLAIEEWSVRYTNGSFFRPEDSHLWARLSHEQMQVLVAERFSGMKLCRKHSDFRQIVEHMAAVFSHEGFFDDAPAGVASPDGFHVLGPDHCIETQPLALAHRQAWSLPIAPDFQAESPLLDAVLMEAFAGDDPAAQSDLWWQAVGASLFGLMPRLQTVLLMIGRERSGKSLLQRVFERVFPSEAVCAVSPASWGHEYHVATLAGKRINMVGELSDEAPIPAAAFKNVTGQNLVAGRHPTHRPFSFRCMAAHCFASNVLPPTTDRSEAFYRRWRVLRFSNTVPADRVDPGLFDKVVGGEMPAILAHAFLGAERVAKAGQLRSTPAHLQVLEKWRHAANPLQQFLADSDWVELDPDATSHTPAHVYEVYRKWASLAGFRNPFGRNHFLDLLDATGATRGLTIKRVGTKQCVVGLRLVRVD